MSTIFTEPSQLALARALLADPPLMVLDEPTAHLDPDSRQALMADILTVTEGRATLLITHELDGLDQVDEIVVLDHGRVVAPRHARRAARYQRHVPPDPAVKSPLWMMPREGRRGLLGSPTRQEG